MKDKTKDASAQTTAKNIEVDPTIEGVEGEGKSATDESIDLADAGDKSGNTATTASDDEVTQKVNIPSPETLAGAKTGDDTDDVSSAGLNNKSAKVLGLGVAAIIVAALIIGYFVTRANPGDAVRVTSNPPISAPTSPTQPGVEIKVPLPTGVDATDCRPDQVVVDHANHALVFPASCSKITFARPAQ